MSKHAKVKVFYGLCFEAGSGDAGKFRAIEELADFMSNGCVSDGIEAVRFGCADAFEGVGLALEGTVAMGRSWEPIELALWPVEPGGEGGPLRSFCEAHGLTWSEPKWWAVPYYG